jgi:hypothetical protein
MLRLPEATDFLLELIATADEPIAVAVLSALRVQAHNPRLRERITEIVERRDLPALRDRFRRDFSRLD